MARKKPKPDVIQDRDTADNILELIQEFENKSLTRMEEYDAILTIKNYVVMITKRTVGLMVTKDRVVRTNVAREFTVLGKRMDDLEKRGAAPWPPSMHQGWAKKVADISTILDDLPKEDRMKLLQQVTEGMCISVLGCGQSGIELDHDCDQEDR